MSTPAALDERAIEPWVRDGWRLSGGGAARYVVGADPGEPRGDHFALAIAPRGDPTNLYGVFLRVVPAAPYLEKRIRVSLSTKARGATQRADAWSRVQSDDGPPDGSGLFFATVELGPDSAWTDRSFVLDVPKNASRIEIGAGLAGPGRVWLDDVKLEIVPDDTPLTGHEKDQELGGWWIVGDASAKLEDGALHVTIADDHRGATELRRILPTGGARKASCAFEVRSAVASASTCFLGDRFARFSESGGGSTTKAIPPTPDGFVRCELAFEPPAKSAFTACGLVVSSAGDVWIRGGALTLR